MATIEFPDDLIELERSAWAEIQAGALTLDTAQAVQDEPVAERETAGGSTPEPEPEVTAAAEEAPASEVEGPAPTEGTTERKPTTAASGFTGKSSLLDEPDPWD